MAESERVILTNMCMVYDHAGHILVEDRRKRGSGWHGVTFPGGHVEPGESFCASVIREVREETGLTIEHPKLCGIKQFFTEQVERYIVLFFKTDCFSGELQPSEEGDVFWIARAQLEEYKLAPGFSDMIRVFESEDISEMMLSFAEGEWQTHLW